MNNFVVAHSKITEKKWKELLFKTGELSRDIGTSVIGKDAVRLGLTDSLGGIAPAMAKLQELISAYKKVPKGLTQ